MKKIIPLFVLMLLFLFPQKVLASGFQIKTIGALDMDGVTYGHIWYTTTNPLITGITTANTDVNISVDGNAEKVSADSDGNWIFHSSLGEGDHTLTFTSRGSTITKTLTIGNVPENIGALPKAQTPTVGNLTPTVILFVSGTLLILAYPLLKKINS